MYADQKVLLDVRLARWNARLQRREIGSKSLVLFGRQESRDALDRNCVAPRQLVGHVDDKSGVVLLDHGDGSVMERRNQAHGKVGHEPADDRAVT